VRTNIQITRAGLLASMLLLLLVKYAFSQEAVEMECSGEKNFSLSRAETHVRHPLLERYDVTYYLLDLAVNDTSTFIEGSVSVTGKVTVGVMDSLVLELSDELLVDSIQINMVNVEAFIHHNELLIMPVSQSFIEGEYFTVRVFYHGSPSGQGFLSGMTNRTDSFWKKRVTYTLSESFHSKDWFPCKQVLTDKADSACIIITTPPGRMAGSNGLLSGITRLDDGRLKYKWLTRHPIAYYLLSIVVSDFQDYSIYASSLAGGDSILIQNFIYSDSAYLANNKENIDKTADMLVLLSQLYSEYPFSDEKYGHCVAPMGGGMEHQTMTTLSSFSFDLVAHELGHQWFGDHVTCASWQDIWISEGFASYTEYLCREFLMSREEADSWMSGAHSRAYSEPEGSIFIPLEDAENEFRIFSTALSYKKGASIIHMLRHELDNDSVFFQVLRNFQLFHGDDAASGLDFKEILEETSGRDFDWFFDQWYYGEGYPLFAFVWWQTEDSLTVYSVQSGSSPSTPFFRAKLDFRVVFAGGRDTLLTIDQTSAVQYLQFSLDEMVENVFPDPMNWLLEKSSITKKLPEDYVRINPNPFQDEIQLEFQTGNTERLIMISDLQGKIYWQDTTQSSMIKIPTSRLNQGMYMISIREANDTYSAKMIKK